MKKYLDKNITKTDETDEFVFSEKDIQNETYIPDTFSLSEYLKEKQLFYQETIVNEPNDTVHLIPLDEWNIKTGMNISVTETDELDFLNKKLEESQSKISVREEKYEVVSTIVKENRFYTYTQKLKEIRHKTYIVITQKQLNIK